MIINFRQLISLLYIYINVYLWHIYKLHYVETLCKEKRRLFIPVMFQSTQSVALALSMLFS